MRKIVFTFTEIVLYSKFVSKVKKRRRRKEKTNIYVEHLQFNIVLYHNIDNFLSETKAKVIDKDADSTSDVLLIIDTSLIIDDSKYDFKNKLIPTVRRNDEKMIYINNNSFLRIFFKFVIDYIFKMNCNYWMGKLVACEPFLQKDETKHSS